MLERAVQREAKSLNASLKALFQTSFSCREDARIAWEEAFGKIRYHRPSDGLVTEETGYAQSGRPRKNATPEVLGYRLSGSFETDQEAISMTLERKGFFVVATNVLDEDALPAPELIALYKAQGTSIEAGFRFYKDPLFFADAFFLKSEKRIMALTMIMGIALLIYSLAEEELRSTLKKLKASLPNQKKKPTNRPTMRWIFQLMDGINWRPCPGRSGGSHLDEGGPEKNRLLLLSGGQSDLRGSVNEGNIKVFKKKSRFRKKPKFRDRNLDGLFRG